MQTIHTIFISSQGPFIRLHYIYLADAFIQRDVQKVNFMVIDNC
uniref:Uncharacterized protein n=1 Tax=Anguilla anguilla TaxID=7936 RepID=A0A0E9R8T9_ANGAN